uniref:Uncharacterized protein n=1 Tax=Anguilla anguilla TaxID=7936 RepID=A0A0E9QE76_ANGAN
MKTIKELRLSPPPYREKLPHNDFRLAKSRKPLQGN